MKKRISALFFMLLLTFVLSANVSAASNVAKIGSKNYTSLSKAFAAVKTGETITLTNNATYTGNLVLSLGSKKVTLNLNKKTMKVSKALNLTSGSITITGSGKLQAKEIQNFGSLTISSGTITASIYNAGNLTIKGGTLINTSGYDYTIFTDGGAVTMTKGTIKYQRPFEGEKSSELGGPEVSNGSAIMTERLSSVSIKGGKITSTSNIILTSPNSKSLVVLSDGTFQSAEGGCIAILGHDMVYITGGKYSIKRAWGFSYIFGDGTLLIKDGTFNSEWTLIETYTGDANAVVFGGSFSSLTDKNGVAMFLSFDGKINMKGGTIKAPNNAYAFWTGKVPDKERIKVSDNVKINSKNLWKKTDNPC